MSINSTGGAGSRDSSSASRSSVSQSSASGTATTEARKTTEATTPDKATTPQARDLSVSTFEAAPAARVSPPSLQAPQFTSRLLDPTPVAQRTGLQAPQLTQRALDPASLGPASSFQPVTATAARQTAEATPADPAVEATEAQEAAQALPEPVTLNLSASVGANGANVPADVRQIQDRLHDLGYLSDEHYQAELADPAQTDAIAEQDMPQTMEALREFQRGATGFTDGNVSPTGLTARVMADPTYGTQTTVNRGATDPTAGVPVETFALSPQVEEIVRAVEAVETGTGVLSESPARLANASGTPASFGRGQLIGSTAVEMLNRYPEVAEHYGLDATEVQSMRDVATRTSSAFTEISHLVPNGGFTEAELQRAIETYTAANGEQFHQDTGLGNGDIENMFRAAQLREQLPGRGETGDVDTLLADPDIAANVEALGLRRSDVNTYVNNPAFHGENRAGFVTRALFSSENGQALRDAMTDNGGVPLSRGLIQDNYNQVTRRGQELLGRPLTAAEAAEATMLVHNRGMGALEGLVRSFSNPHRTVDPYVARAMQHWTPQ